MATITNAQLTIAHDHRKKTAKVRVTCKVNFTALELCHMKTCGGRHFKVKAKLWGADSGLTGADDFLYTLPTVRYFPDATPSATEDVVFEDTVGEGLLDEDWGRDEVYARIYLQNLFTLNEVRRNTNVVSHSF